MEKLREDVLAVYGPDTPGRCGPTLFVSRVVYGGTGYCLKSDVVFKDRLLQGYRQGNW